MNRIEWDKVIHREIYEKNKVNKMEGAGTFGQTGAQKEPLKAGRLWVNFHGQEQKSCMCSSRGVF